MDFLAENVKYVYWHVGGTQIIVGTPKSKVDKSTTETYQ